MPRREILRTKSISYGDLLAQLFLWQKAFLLAPVWGVIVIPILGFVCRAMGNGPTQLGFGLVLGISALYFLEDMLKRKIRLDDDRIYFGFRAFDIKSIIGVEVLYKKGKFLPASLVLNFEKGKQLKLSLGGLTEEGVDTLIKHLQARNSNLKTAAVLNTLVKCRSIKRKPLESGDKLEIAYHSRRFVGENIDVFKSTARKWMRVGPVLTCVLFGPCWMGFLSQLYSCLQPHSYTSAMNLNLNRFFSQLFEALLSSLGRSASKANEAFMAFAENPLVAVLTAAGIALFILYLFKLLWRANYVCADPGGLKLILRIGDISVSLGSVKWSQIQEMSLSRKNSSSCKVKITLSNKKKMELDLSCINEEDRALLLARMEKYMPHKQIDPELSQAMLPKSERSYTEIWLQSLNQAPERKTLEPLEPGQIVGENRFEVLRSIGVGGQGTAYLCRDLQSETAEAVVLKESIIPVFADSSVRRKALEKFEQEASLLKSLDSPGVVKLLDYFVEDHRAYLLMEHLDGCNLRELVAREGPMSEERVRDLALQMTDVLKFLHAHGVVHRDFTPDNLILNSKGKLKLIDFNVAQQIQGGSSGTIVGKHAYLPPEQFRGKASAQSDLYAFGATLYYLLSAHDPEPISQSSPRSVKADLSEAMDKLVQKSTALQLNNRFENAEEIEKALLAMELDEAQVICNLNESTSEVEVAQHG
ncbi:MAG: serine/threonine protein kinase [Candidatus Obscuribacterales bacterium]|nr:serine/threonine protein kinase [Candidatus Obscuribacterales bacterium]